MLDPESSVPLYQQVKEGLIKEIQAGLYPKGARMPSEYELGEKYSVSRITIRRAVAELCEEQLLVKKQGKGTFVAGDIISSDLTKTLGFHDFMASQGKSVETVILEKGETDDVKPSIRKDLSLLDDDPVLVIKRLMKADGIPMMVDYCYLPLNLFPSFGEKFEAESSVFHLLRDEYGIHIGKFQKIIKVRKATPELAKLLSYPEGDPVFDLYKITYDSNEVPVLISISYAKGEGTSYTINGNNNDSLSHDGVKWD